MFPVNIQIIQKKFFTPTSTKLTNHRQNRTSLRSTLHCRNIKPQTNAFVKLPNTFVTFFSIYVSERIAVRNILYCYLIPFSFQRPKFQQLSLDKINSSCNAINIKTLTIAHIYIYIYIYNCIL